MQRLQRIVWTASLLAVALAPAVLVGCGDDESVTGITSFADPAFSVEDPLDGVLNSTEGSTPADPAQRILRLAERLGLTEEQTEALLAAYEEFRAGIQALREQVENGELGREEAHALAVELREAFEAELQVILTPEQYEQLQEMRQDRDGRGRGHRDPQMRWQKWLEEIGASEEQAEAVFEALRALHEGMMELRQEFRAGEMTPEEAREAAQALREAFEEALQEILTPEQYEQLQELRPDRPGHDRGHGPGGR